VFTRLKAGYWLLLGVAALELAIAGGLGTTPFSAYFQSNHIITLSLPAMLLLPLIWCGLVAIAITRRQVDRPFIAMRRMIFINRHWIVRGLMLMMIILVIGRAFNSYKIAISEYVPFYADDIFIKMDRAIFGVDPWLYTHALIGPLGTAIIDRIYTLWFVVMLLVLGCFCFTRDLELQVRGFLSYLLTWGLLGIYMATVFSSVGPCFYEQYYGKSDFSALMQSLRERHNIYEIRSIFAMDYLTKSMGKDRIAAGISAMPSMHVAIAYLCFLVTKDYNRHFVVKMMMFLFFFVILIGSVHLGWHYAVDGIAGIIGVGLIWWGTGRFVNWVDMREQQRVPDPGMRRVEPLSA
jgi:PAP2 superfamily